MRSCPNSAPQRRVPLKDRKLKSASKQNKPKTVFFPFLKELKHPAVFNTKAEVVKEECTLRTFTTYYQDRKISVQYYYLNDDGTTGDYVDTKYFDEEGKECAEPDCGLYGTEGINCENPE